MHQADHRMRWLWATHAVHHSPNQFNLSAAYRLGWTAPISGAALFFAPLVWIGYPPFIVLAALAIDLICQFWLYTELIGHLGPFEWFLNTPSHHRVHHATSQGYLDRNFGGVLIIFGRIFGTFAPENELVPCTYGLVQPLSTHNPIRIAFHAWGAMFRELAAAGGLQEIVLTLFGRRNGVPPVFVASNCQQRARCLSD